MKQEIVTGRVLLQPLTMRHARGLFEVYRDPETMRYWSSPAVPDLLEAERMVRADLDMMAAGHALFWALKLRTGGKVVGKCTLVQYSPANQRAEIGYILGRAHWRQGLMSEALTALIDFCFTELELHRIEADTDEDNHASVALLASLGFRQEGLFRQRWLMPDGWKDSLMFGLIRPDWERRRT